MWLKENLKKISSRLNQNKRVVDLRNDSNDPWELMYSYKGSSVVVNLSPKFGISLPALALLGDEKHPFVSALEGSEKLKTEEEKLNYLKNKLRTYYSNFQPKSASEALNVDIEYSNRELLNFPPYAMVLPWQSVSLESQKASIESSVIKENKPFDRNLDIRSGWAWSGPVSDKKIEIESKRLLYVYSSIKEKGYLRSDKIDGDIIANILHKNEGSPVVWQCTIGQHRCFSLTALGFDSIPCRVSNIIRREDVNIWPNVKNGLFTVEESLKIFDSFYEKATS